MTDESAAPPAPDPIKPAPGPRPPGARPPVRKSAPPPPAKPPSDLKKWLVLGIIGSSVILIGLIGWRLYVKFSRPPQVVRNVKADWENSWQTARLAQKEMFSLQSKAWVKGEPLTDEEMAKFKAGLTTLQKTAETYHELMTLLREKGKLDSQEANDMNSTQVQLKAWIWDANGVVDPGVKPPKYGGLYVPMFAAEKRMQAAAKRLKELKEGAQEIVRRGDAAEIAKTVEEVKALADQFALIRDELRELDDNLLAGLTMPDLKKEQLADLADIREYQSIAQMSFMMARDLRSAFPSPEDKPQEPPKEENPKPEPPKEEPPKAEEPPKPEPPKETPPKQEPPKEEPPKPEPPKTEDPPKETSP